MIHLYQEWSPYIFAAIFTTIYLITDLLEEYKFID